ncbi:uncharacterized protein [Lolium perenne]|uniref:uncharacterized protein n=1 Tax=Lolium perenne TaxID=4522 RepID=UPI003A992FE4
MPGKEDGVMKDSEKASSLMEVAKSSAGGGEDLGGAPPALAGKKRKDERASDNGGVAKRVLRSNSLKLRADAEPEGEAAAADGSRGESLEKGGCDEAMDEVQVEVDDAVQVAAKGSEENNVESSGVAVMEVAEGDGLDSQTSDKEKADEKTDTASHDVSGAGARRGSADDPQENKGTSQGEVIDPSATANDGELGTGLGTSNPSSGPESAQQDGAALCTEGVVLHSGDQGVEKGLASPVDETKRVSTPDIVFMRRKSLPRNASQTKCEEEPQVERRVTRSSTVRKKEVAGSSGKSSAKGASMETTKGRKEDVLHHYTRKVSNTESLKADHADLSKRSTSTKKHALNGKVTTRRNPGVTGNDDPANITENKASATAPKISLKPKGGGSIAKTTTKDAVSLVDQNVCSSAITEKNDTELTDSEGARSENKTAVQKSGLSVGAKIVASKKRLLESGSDKTGVESPVETPSMKKTKEMSSHTEVDQSTKSSGEMLTGKNSSSDKKGILKKRQHHSRAAESSRSVNPSIKTAIKLSHNEPDDDGTDISIANKRNCRGRREPGLHAVKEEEDSTESEELVTRKDRQKRKKAVHKQRSGSPKASYSKGNGKAENDAGAKSGDPGEQVTASLIEEKRKISDQIKTILLAAGWTIDLRPRNGRNYMDSVYIPPTGKGSYWSVTKAYAVYQSKQSEEKDGATSQSLSKQSPGSPGKTHSLPEDLLGKLKRVVVNKRRPKFELQKLRKKKHGLLKKSKNSKGKPKEGKISKERKKRGGCALLARGSKGGSSTDGFAPYEWKRSVFSWLIDLDVLPVNASLKCMDENRSKVLLEGSISRDGINCSCCSKVFAVHEFVAHAGGQVSKPYRNILVDGLDNDLLHCLISAWNKQSDSERQAFFDVSTEGNDDPNDDTCGICGDGGNLMCCDGCPSTFHMSCLELEELPSDDWRCANCSCKFCKEHLNEDAPDNAEVDSLHSCFQCKEKYHPACSPETENLSGVPCQAGNQFCQQSCRLLFEELQSLLAVKKDLEPEFACRIIQCIHEDVPETVLDLDERVECNSKIAVALSLMDECFLPIIDQRTGINLIRNAVYNCGSNFLRLDFRGFYIFILERGDEIVSAASVRIHGTKLAEMPFIGTRHMYRRQGMCRRLLDGIEKILSSLKVEMLVIPAINELVDTWTSKFGFSPLEVSHKQEVKSINMLVFPGTGLLQKPLLNKSSPQEHPGPEGDEEAQGSEVMDSLNSSKGADTCQD